MSPSPAPMTVRRRLELIRDDLAALAGGNLFCMDRGFAWTLESEGAYRERIAYHFEHEPELTRLLPEVAARLARGELLADTDDAYDAVVRCLGRSGAS